MKAHRIIALALVAFMSVQLTTLPVALAQETATKPTANSDGTLTLVHQYAATEEPPVLPESITQGGKTYTLDTTTTAPAAEYEPPKQTFIRTAFSEVPLLGINNLGTYFPATYPISEGDYQGEIGLDATAPYTVVERYETLRVQVDRTATIAGLPDNDVTRVPATQTFEVSSSAYPGATETATLQLLDVAYEVAGTDYLGLPNNYTAYLTYRGQEEYLELHHYDVRANYAGELVSSEEQIAITGTYNPVAQTTAVTAEDAAPLAAPGFSLVPLAIAGASVVIILVLPILYLFFLTNARLLRVTGEDGSAGKRESNISGKNKSYAELVCRRRMVLHDGMAEFKIPSSIDIMSGDEYHLTIKERLACREGEVRLIWRDKIVAVLPLDNHLTINFRELLIVSVEAALIETNALD